MSVCSDIDGRIDRLAARASRSADEGLLVEIEDALATGYMCALRRDAHARRLARRLDELAERMTEDGVAAEIVRLRREQRATEESTRALRARLAGLRQLTPEFEGRSSSL